MYGLIEFIMEALVFIILSFVVIMPMTYIFTQMFLLILKEEKR
jgi:hypothetical protein